MQATGTTTRSKRNSKPTVGFLTVVEDENDVLFGGFLVLNQAGRPLEFLCTAPIRPNRAQEILYGATLEPFLYGEQIGQTLLEKSKATPWLVCTDRPAAMAVGDFTDIPVALVLPSESGTGEALSEVSQKTGKQFRLDAAHSSPTVGGSDGVGQAAEGLYHVHFGANDLAFADEAVQNDSQLATELDSLGQSLDLNEPFERIRQAIEEARSGGASR